MALFLLPTIAGFFCVRNLDVNLNVYVCDTAQTLFEFSNVLTTGRKKWRKHLYYLSYFLVSQNWNGLASEHDLLSTKSRVTCFWIYRLCFTPRWRSSQLPMLTEDTFFGIPPRERMHTTIRKLSEAPKCQHHFSQRFIEFFDIIIPNTSHAKMQC